MRSIRTNPGDSWSRRAVLRNSALGGAGLAAAVLIGCSRSDDGSGEKTDGGGGGAPSTLRTTDERPETLPDGWIWEKQLPFPFQYPDPAGTPKPGGVMKFVSNSDVSIFDPVRSSAQGTLQVTNTVYDHLLGFRSGPEMDPYQLHLQPELAESWERTPDGLTYTFKLAPGVKFHNVAPLNGRNFAASDVKSAYEMYKASGQGTSYFVNVDSIQAVDSGTLKITMKKAVADFVENLAGRFLPVFPRELMDAGLISQKAIGTGPMILKEASTTSHITYDRNPEYFQRRVLLEGVEQQIILDPAARLAAFRAGQVDADTNTVVGIADARALLETNPDVQIHISSNLQGGSAVYALAMNLELPKFQDERVRRAIAMSIDRDLIIRLVHQGNAKGLPKMPWTYVFKQEPSGAELGPYWRYAPAEATKLLAAAGATGLEINSIYYQYSARETQTAEILVDTMRQSGIKFNSQSVENQTFTSQWNTRKLPEATTTGFGGAGYDADGWFYSQVHSSSPNNRWRINDPQLDRWAEQQQVELDPTKRREILRKMWDHEQEKIYCPGLPSGFTYLIAQPWIRGVRNSVSSGNTIISEAGRTVAAAWIDK